MGPKTKARTAIERWWAKHGNRERVGRVRHVHARGVVVGYAAPLCLVVRLDGRESEKHMREWQRKYPLSTVHKFDTNLREGDACYYGYVSTGTGGEPVAVVAGAERR